VTEKLKADLERLRAEQQRTTAALAKMEAKLAALQRDAVERLGAMRYIQRRIEEAEKEDKGDDITSDDGRS